MAKTNSALVATLQSLPRAQARKIAAQIALSIASLNASG